MRFNDRYIADGQTIVELKTNDVSDVVVRVRHGLEVKGHVEPREICEVAFAKDGNGDGFTGPRADSVMTTDNGDFRFAPFAPGVATVAARCPNGDEGMIDVTVAVDAPDRVVPVKPGGSIAGRVVDTKGDPIVGVTVAVEPAGDGQVTQIVNGTISSGFKAITSTGGAFEIRGLGAANHRLAVLDRGRPMKVTKGARVALAAAQQATGIEIVVQRPAGTIRGTVIGPDGVPLADAWVALVQRPEDLLESLNTSDDDKRPVWVDGGGGGDLPPALSDARGYFELSSVPHGTYQVVAEAQSGRLRGRAVNVTPDAQIAIQLAAVGSLRGAVHGARGPSELFSVNLAGPTADDRSFTDGAFEFPRVDPGDYTIQVTSTDGTGRATVHVPAGGAASVDIALVANAIVTGRLVDKTLHPVPGMTVALITQQLFEQHQMLFYSEPPSSGPDGRFRVEGQPGKMALVVLGRPPAFKPGLLLEAGRTIDVGDVTIGEPK